MLNRLEVLGVIKGAKKVSDDNIIITIETKKDKAGIFGELTQIPVEIKSIYVPEIIQKAHIGDSVLIIGRVVMNETTNNLICIADALFLPNVQNVMEKVNVES